MEALTIKNEVKLPSTWKLPPPSARGKGCSFWKPSFSGSMSNFRGVGHFQIGTGHMWGCMPKIQSEMHMLHANANILNVQIGHTYVCVYINIYASIYIHTYTHIYVYINIYRYIIFSCLQARILHIHITYLTNKAALLHTIILLSAYKCHPLNSRKQCDKIWGIPVK